jgi:excisionase family DNA binding protein
MAVEQHYSLKEAARLLGVHHRTMHRWVATGVIWPVVVLSQRDYRLAESVITEFLSSRIVSRPACLPNE